MLLRPFGSDEGFIVLLSSQLANYLFELLFFTLLREFIFIVFKEFNHLFSVLELDRRKEVFLHHFQIIVGSDGRFLFLKLLLTWTWACCGLLDQLFTEVFHC
jgi:hypothetical protein